MKKFERLNDFSDDELIIIVYGQSEDWQIKAVEYAKDLLNQRGVKEETARHRIKEIEKEIEILWRKELAVREKESYGIIELIFMSLFWIRYILWDWYLKKEGYLKKHKQRLYAIGSGIIFYLIIPLNIALSGDQYMEDKLKEINEISEADSVKISKIDWSGLYTFKDTSSTKENNIIWELNVIKEDSEHNAYLKLTRNDEIISFPCVCLAEEETLEVYSDSLIDLYESRDISYNDLLFTFVKDGNDILTYWKIMKPYYNINYKSRRLFNKAGNI